MMMMLYGLPGKIQREEDRNQVELGKTTNCKRYMESMGRMYWTEKVDELYL